MKLGLVLVSGILLSACSSGNTKVNIVKKLAPEVKKTLTKIGSVKCELGMNGRSKNSNKEGCENKVRNEAAELGGTIVLLKTKKKSSPENQFLLASGTSYCDNCVEMSGVVYK